MKARSGDRRPAAHRIAVRLIAVALIAPAGAGAASHGAPHAVLMEQARAIQNICFAAYPTDLLLKMSGREGPPPPNVRDDPRLQRKYLRTEALVSKGLFYPSLLDELLPAFEAEVGPGVRFLDLGSGDGRVVFLAALMGARATGIEFDRALHRVARDARHRLEPLVPREGTRLRRGDFFREDFSTYDLLFYFGRGSYGETRLLAKIARELAPGARVLLAHADKAPEGLVPVGDYGPVRVFRRGEP